MEIYDLKRKILKAIKKTGNTQQKKSRFLIIPDLVNILAKDLGKNQYKPSRFSCFVVKDPKIREVFAPDYTDRVVHHIIINEIGNYIDRKFIFDSYANRKDKGTHFAVKRTQKILKNVKNEYCLKADIKAFFPSINKNILWRLVRDHISKIKEMPPKDRSFVLDLCGKIIFQNPVDPAPILTGNENLLSSVPREKSLFHIPRHKGLPIGSLTSQFFANIYLNELDQFVKHKLKAKHYVRYVDDFVILGENAKDLAILKKEIQDFIQKELDLSLHPGKTVIQHKSKGIDFLGYIIRERYLLVRKRTVKSFKRRIYFFNHLLDPKNFPIADPPSDFKFLKRYSKRKLIAPVVPSLPLLQKILAVINSYYGVFSFANTYNLRKTLYENHFHLLKKYFIPQEEDYRMIKIRPALIKKAGRK